MARIFFYIQSLMSEGEWGFHSTSLRYPDWYRFFKIFFQVSKHIFNVDHFQQQFIEFANSFEKSINKVYFKAYHKADRASPFLSYQKIKMDQFDNEHMYTISIKLRTIACVSNITNSKQSEKIFRMNLCRNLCPLICPNVRFHIKNT